MKQIRLLFISFLFIAVLTACQSGGAPASPQSTLQRAITSEPAGLDPQGAASSGQNVILPYLFDTLIYRNTDNTYKPYLAEKWEISPDGRVFTFHLQEALKFHDGTLLDAQSVVFTFERFKQVGAKSPLASAINQIQTVQALDALTVQFTLQQHSSTFLGTLAMPYAGILSPTAARKNPETFGQAPVGSGPFRFAAWQPGVSITLESNPDYRWGPAAVKNPNTPHLKQVVFKVLPDATTQLAALQKGEIDLLFVNQPDQLQKLAGMPDLQRIPVQLNSLVYLSFQCQRPALQDVRLRQALAHAVNKDEILKTALNGVGQTAFAPLSPTLPGYTPELKAYEQAYDPQKAKALLGEAGYSAAPDGGWQRDGQVLTLDLLTSTRAPNPAIATILQSQFQAVGVPVAIRQFDAGAVQEKAAAGEFDLLLWRYDWNDADVLNVYLSSERIGSTNRAFYSNPALDDLLNRAGQEMDETARNQLYFAAQKIILTDAPWQPLYVPQDVIVARPSVRDLVVGAMGRVWLNDASLR